MKKIILIISVVVCFLCCFGCNKDGSDTESQGVVAEKTNYIKYVTTFDTYNECVINANGNGKKSVNKDTNYISQGVGSMKVHSYAEIFGWWIMGNNFVSQVDDLSEAKCLSLDIYNPNEFEIEISLTIVTYDNDLLFAISQTCEGNGWTEVFGIFDRAQINEIDAPVGYYQLTVENKQAGAFDFYIDDFYVEFAPSESVEKMTKVFSDKEIQNFDTIMDLNYIQSFMGSGRVLVNFQLNTDPYYAKEGCSLRLDISASDPGYMEIWNHTQYLYSGFRFNREYLKSAGISEKTSVITLWVYNTNVSRKKVYIKVYDKNGYSAQNCVWVYPETWTELRLDDFGSVNCAELNQMEVYFEGLHTFDSYSLFIDSITFEVA